jgi:phosphoserine phosphatase
MMTTPATARYLVACDFDQTLSFNDSGFVLSELIGVADFQRKVAGLSATHLVQQGAELAYLLRHDPEFRCVRPEHLMETGKRVRLKKDIGRLLDVLSSGEAGGDFSFRVISAAPRLVIQSALDGIVPSDHIHGSDFEYDPLSGEICAITKVPAGYGKVTVLEDLEAQLQISPTHTVYVGDGSSDVHVMLHVNKREGFTVAVSETARVTRIAKRTVLGDSTLSVLVPMLEDVLGWDTARIRRLFESYGLVLQEWDKARTDWVTVGDYAAAGVEL